MALESDRFQPETIEFVGHIGTQASEGQHEAGSLVSVTVLGSSQEFIKPDADQSVRRRLLFEDGEGRGANDRRHLGGGR